MKILLIYPVEREFMPPCVFPLGIAYIESVLSHKGHEVDILDMNAERNNAESKLEHFLSETRYDWIGVSSIITQYKKVKQLAQKIKKIDPSVLLIMGGAGPTSFPELYINYANADIVVVGEGEVTVTELCNLLEINGNIERCRGLCFRKKGGIYFTQSRPAIPNLDFVPFPEWHKFRVQTYMENFLFNPPEARKGINIITSRGCPGRCTYCMLNFGNKVRHRSVDNIIEEITGLYHDYGVDHLHFIDDTIAYDKNRLSMLAENIISKHLPLSWSANARVNHVTPELLKKMAISGCIQLAYGIESADKEILKEMKKGINPEQAAKAIKWTRDVGIDVKAYFMIGFPSEDEFTIRNTVRFCKDNLVGGEFFFLTPFPGSEIYKYVVDKGLIKNDDLYLQVAGEVRNFVINCTKTLDNETLFTLKEQAEAEIQQHLREKGIVIKPSIRDDPRESVKNLPKF